MKRYSLRAATFAFAALALGQIVASPAVAMSGSYGYWSTAADPNPMPYTECLRRAPAALTAAAPGPLTNDVHGGQATFATATDDYVVFITCIIAGNGFIMKLDAVGGDNQHATSYRLYVAVSNAFWGTVPTPTTNQMTMTIPDIGWQGTWTQRPGTNIWDTKWQLGGDIRTTVSQGGWNGASGTFTRTYSSDGVLCTYNLTLDSSGLTFTGTQSCPGLQSYRVTGTLWYPG